MNFVPPPRYHISQITRPPIVTIPSYFFFRTCLTAAAVFFFLCASCLPADSCSTTTGALPLLGGKEAMFQWTSGALLEFIFPPLSTSFSGPAGAFLYTTTRRSSSLSPTPPFCMWAGSDVPISMYNGTSAAWNSTFTKWDDAFASIWNLSAIDGVTGTSAEFQWSSTVTSKAKRGNATLVLIPSELCFMSSSAAATLIGCESSLSTSSQQSTALDCLLDPTNVLMPSSAFQPLTPFGDYVTTVIPLRALARRWFASSIHFIAESRGAQSTYLSAIAAPTATSASGATVSHLTGIEKEQVFKGIADSLLALLEAHVADVLVPKWKWIEELVSTQNAAMRFVLSSSSSSGPLLSSGCPTEFLSSWKSASSVSMGISIVEAALGTSVSLLLASQTEVEIRARAQCVIETFAVTRWLEEDLPALVTHAQAPVANAWTPTTLGVLAHELQEANSARLGKIISNRLTLAALSSLLQSLVGVGVGGSPISPQCLSEWFSNISSPHSFLASNTPSWSSPSQQAAVLAWLRSGESAGLAQCFRARVEGEEAGGTSSNNDALTVVSEVEWGTDFTRGIQFESIVVGNSSLPGVVRVSFLGSEPRLRAESSSRPIVFTAVLSPHVFGEFNTATSSATLQDSAKAALGMYGVPMTPRFHSEAIIVDVFAPNDPPVGILRNASASSLLLSGPPLRYTWTESVHGPLNSSCCGVGFLQLRDYDTNATICQECRHEDPNFIFCTGDGYARACTNKPGGLDGGAVSAFIPQGLRWSSAACPFYCRNVFQFRSSDNRRCVAASMGYYPVNDTAQAPCQPHPALLRPQTSVVHNNISVGGGYTMETADFSAWAAFVSPGSFASVNSCAFAVRRRMVSGRFEAGGGLSSSLMWCNRSQAVLEELFRARGAPRPPMGIQLKIFAAFRPAELLALHRQLDKTRLAFQLAEVFVETLPDGEGGGWSWYLVTSVDSTFSPTTISFQFWFNASFIPGGNPEGFFSAPHSLLFFSHNRTFAWSSLPSSVRFRAGLSLNLESGLLAFTLNGSITGPLSTVPWSASLAQRTCLGPHAASYRLAIGGWLASFATPPQPAPVMTRLGGIADTLPHDFYVFPMNVTRVAFSPVPFSSPQFPQSYDDAGAVDVAGFMLPVVVVGNTTTADSSACLPGRRIDDGTAFAATPPRRDNHIVYLHALMAAFNSSNTTWDGRCRGGLYKSISGCVACPTGSVWQATGGTGNALTMSPPLSASCVCIATRALVNNSCVPLKTAFAPPVIDEGVSVTDGAALIQSTLRREKTLVVRVAVNSSNSAAPPVDGLPRNGSLEVTVACTSADVFGESLTDISIECNENTSVCAVFVSMCVDFSSSAAATGQGDGCTVRARVTQAYRYPSSTVSRRFAVRPRAPPLTPGNLNLVSNGSVLPDHIRNISLTVRNYTFFTTASTYGLAKVAAAIATSSSSSNSSPAALSLLQFMAGNATESCQIVVVLSFYARMADALSGGNPSTPSSMFVFPASAGSEMVVSLSSASPSSSNAFRGNVAILSVSVTSAVGYFAQSDPLQFLMVSESFAQRELSPIPNKAADALSHPATLTLTVLVLAVLIAMLTWTVQRRPPRCMALLATGCGGSSSASDYDEEDDGEEDITDNPSDGDDPPPQNHHAGPPRQESREASIPRAATSSDPTGAAERYGRSSSTPTSPIRTRNSRGGGGGVRQSAPAPTWATSSESEIRAHPPIFTPDQSYERASAVLGPPSWDSSRHETASSVALASGSIDHDLSPSARSRWNQHLKGARRLGDADVCASGGSSQPHPAFPAHTSTPSTTRSQVESLRERKEEERRRHASSRERKDSRKQKHESTRTPQVQQGLSAKETASSTAGVETTSRGPAEDTGTRERPWKHAAPLPPSF